MAIDCMWDGGVKGAMGASAEETVRVMASTGGVGRGADNELY